MISNRNVQIIKFMNGEEIICDLVSRNEKTVVVKTPYMVVPNPTGGIAILPWSIACLRAGEEDDFEIKEEGVLMVHSAPKVLEDSYIEKVSGLSLSSGLSSGGASSNSSLILE